MVLLLLIGLVLEKAVKQSVIIIIIIVLVIVLILSILPIWSILFTSNILLTFINHLSTFLFNHNLPHFRLYIFPSSHFLLIPHIALWNNLLFILLILLLINQNIRRGRVRDFLLILILVINLMVHPEVLLKLLLDGLVDLLQVVVRVFMILLVVKGFR